MIPVLKRNKSKASNLIINYMETISCFELIESNQKSSLLVDDKYEDNWGSRCHCSFRHKTCFDSNCYFVYSMKECPTDRHPGCMNRNFRTKNKADIYVKSAGEKGDGLFSHHELPKSKFVIEFVGEIIDHPELMKRRAQSTTQHLYPLQLKEGCYLDATHKGGIGRFINHSCEPNSRLEVWTVGDRYRVGIFTIKGVSAESELTIDYDWEPMEGRTPTRCYCGTPSCRGWVERMPDDYDFTQLVTPKSGLWTLASRMPEEAVMDKGGERVLNPSWLVGKRVKVWFEGNRSFFEADVESFDEYKQRHMVRYLIDGEFKAELFLIDWTATAAVVTEPTGSPRQCRGPRAEEVVDRWMWLDETKQGTVIRKKVRAYYLSIN